MTAKQYKIEIIPPTGMKKCLVVTARRQSTLKNELLRLIRIGYDVGYDPVSLHLSSFIHNLCVQINSPSITFVNVLRGDSHCFGICTFCWRIVTFSQLSTGCFSSIECERLTDYFNALVGFQSK